MKNPLFHYFLSGKLRWKSDIGDIAIPFTGVPFLLDAVYQKECMFGHDYQSHRCVVNDASKVSLEMEDCMYCIICIVELVVSRPTCCCIISRELVIPNKDI